jgi:glycosyltransferase involved in cell wall biosynthesis
MTLPARASIVFIWENFGPYHGDRLEAVARMLSANHRVVGIEIGGSSVAYAWDRTGQIDGIEQITLFPAVSRRSVKTLTLAKEILRSCLSVNAQHVFLCNYNRREIFIAATVLRLLGRRVYTMSDSKFDDKPRILWRELLKTAYLLPYNAALVAGTRNADYFRFLGFKAERIHLGYDTVSLDRIRACADTLPAPDGVPFDQRHFTIVARLVPKKNIAMAIDAYTRYCKALGAAARDLYICGSGECEEVLRRQAEPLGDKIKFLGFVQAQDVARILGSSLALILPSTEEQWGLVVNEAIAMGLPVLCSTNVGARDLLVRSGVNGYVYEPDNAAGLAEYLGELGANANLWRRQCEASCRIARLADTGLFVASVSHMITGETYDAASGNPAALVDECPQ